MSDEEKPVILALPQLQTRVAEPPSDPTSERTKKPTSGQLLKREFTAIRDEYEPNTPKGSVKVPRHDHDESARRRVALLRESIFRHSNSTAPPPFNLSCDLEGEQESGAESSSPSATPTKLGWHPLMWYDLKAACRRTGAAPDESVPNEILELFNWLSEDDLAFRIKIMHGRHEPKNEQRSFCVIS